MLPPERRITSSAAARVGLRPVRRVFTLLSGTIWAATRIEDRRADVAGNVQLEAADGEAIRWGMQADHRARGLDGHPERVEQALRVVARHDRTGMVVGPDAKRPESRSAPSRDRSDRRGVLDGLEPCTAEGRPPRPAVSSPPARSAAPRCVGRRGAGAVATMLNMSRRSSAASPPITESKVCPARTPVRSLRLVAERPASSGPSGALSPARPTPRTRIVPFPSSSYRTPRRPSARSVCRFASP